jgi:hypothetical protein
MLLTLSPANLTAQIRREYPKACHIPGQSGPAAIGVLVQVSNTITPDCEGLKGKTLFFDLASQTIGTVPPEDVDKFLPAVLMLDSATHAALNPPPAKPSILPAREVPVIQPATR